MLRKAILGILLLLICLSGYGRESYSVDVSEVKTEVIRHHLDLGGSNAEGDSIAVNSFYIERGGRPYIPVIGEFHYARFPRQYWDEELKKIKAGGVSVVATYVFWILHEFKEGEFDWSGDLDLRYFVELCKQNGLDLIVRIGPFAHGEMRNGGLPDWLYGRPIEVRSNDPAYLYYVNRLYREIGTQLRGLLFKEGGPVIGLQIENEYQHSAAPWAFTYEGAPRENTVARRDVDITKIGVGVNEFGNEFAGLGRDHMKTLKQLALDAGLETPLYTATGWGYATIIEKGSIPVMAGYAYPFWVDSNRPSPFYLYKDIRQNPDYSPVSYDVTLYPSLAAELGTGISVTYSRRPRVPGESFLPMMVRTIGSGSNGLGFYMYHGGNTPSRGNFFMNEGFGLASKSYDYQSPIGEFGQLSKGYYPLRLINYFLQSYGGLLAPMYPVLPATNEQIKAETTDILRYALRSDGSGGFLFMHNFQDRISLPDQEQISIGIKTKSGQLRFPVQGSFTLKSGASAIFPFNLSFDGVELMQATLQPFMRFELGGRTYHAFVAPEGILPQLLLKGSPKLSGSGFAKARLGANTLITFRENEICELRLRDVSFLILPYEKALHTYLYNENSGSLCDASSGSLPNENSGSLYNESSGSRLIISNALVLSGPEGLELLSQKENNLEVLVYPACDKLVAARGETNKAKSPLKSMSAWTISLPAVEPELELIRADDRHFVLRAPQLQLDEISDVYLRFDYRGDRALCMMKGELRSDNLYTSGPWTLGLKRYQAELNENEMYFYFIPMQKEAPYLRWLDREVLPDFGEGKEFLEIKEPEIISEYKLKIEIE